MPLHRGDTLSATTALEELRFATGYSAALFFTKTFRLLLVHLEEAPSVLQHLLSTPKLLPLLTS